MGGNKKILNEGVLKAFGKIHFWNGVFLASFLGLMIQSKVLAIDVENDFPRELQKEERSLITVNGNQKITLIHRLNHLAEKEVVVVLNEIRTGLPDSKRVLLIGRDITSDQLYDLWFIPSDDEGEFVKIHRVHSKKSNGWDVISQFIADGKISTQNNNIIKMAYEGILGFVYTTAHAYKTAKLQTFVLFAMDLYDTEYRIADELEASLDYRKAYDQYKETAVGWEKLAIEAHSSRIVENILPFVDGGIWVTPVGPALKMIGGMSLVKASSVKVAAVLSDILGRSYVGAAKNAALRISGKISQIVLKVPRVASLFSVYAKETAIYLTINDLKNLTLAQISKIYQDKIKVFVVRNSMKNILVSSVKSTRKVGSFGFGKLDTLLGLSKKDWTLISSKAGVELLAEAFDQAKDAYDPNPIIMARNLFIEQDFFKNIYYITSDSLVRAVKPKQFKEGLVQKLAVCGTLSFAEDGRGGMELNVSFRKEQDEGTDPWNTALSEIYKTSLGKIQGSIDKGSIQYFAKKAEQSGNKKVKFAGYAIAMVDQVAGYALKSIQGDVVTWVKVKSSSASEQLKENSTQLAQWFTEQFPASMVNPEDNAYPEVFAEAESIEKPLSELDMKQLKMILKPVYIAENI